MIMEKIAVYGGSFDPPHLGHTRLAQNLAKECGADLVYIIPAASSPFKNGTNAGAADRLEMCRLAFPDSLFCVSDIEISRGGKSYTVDTIRQIKSIHPHSEIYLFMGDDMLLSFNKWYKYEEILKMCRIVTACRTENSEKLSVMQSFSEKYLGGSENVIISNCIPVEISSTRVRESLKNGDESLICRSVYRYIKERGLYCV